MRKKDTIAHYIRKWVPRQITHGMQVLNEQFASTGSILGAPQGVTTSLGRVGYTVVRETRTPTGGQCVLLRSWATVPSTKNDSVGLVWVARIGVRPNGDTYTADPRLVGIGHQLHHTYIAAQHAGCKGWATTMGGYDTPTTRNRLNALTGLSFYQSKGNQYAGKMPIDPHRVYVHPSGIAFQMPQYSTPLDWLYDRANDEEYQYA